LKTGSHLESVLSRNVFAVTAECGPPRGADPADLRRKGELLKGAVDAVNVTDNQRAMVRMSSLASCVVLRQIGLSPVMQMVTRDRNRIALQSDLLGAYALGVDTVLCLSGDHQRFGDHPEAKNVYDIDSLQLLMTIRRMRDEGKFLNGQPIKEPPRFFIGAAANPFADPFEIRVPRLAQKVLAGADFIQTQSVYNLDKFREFMKRVVDRGLHEQVKILAGVTPLKSVRMARYLAGSVPGMEVPEQVIGRLEQADQSNAAAEGIRMCIETIRELKQIPGVAGVHIMAIRWEEKVREIAAGAGLLPRPAA
jgi:methylenetetrahydrofolate reductase (NADPH)